MHFLRKACLFAVFLLVFHAKYDILTRRFD